MEDRIFGFLWRWFWRIAWWGTIAVLGLLALLYISEWADKNPERWGLAVVSGLLGLSVHLLNEIHRRAGMIVRQNDEIILALGKLAPYPTRPLRDRMADFDID